MSVLIDDSECVGCGACADICPGDLIVMRNGKAAIDRPQCCWGCAACVKECAFSAIKFYLGKDMGGAGGFLTVKREGKTLIWIITKPDGAIVTIAVNSDEANKY
ncbi:MAG: 4Fe-4S binding protein [Clostridiales bacterium]|jgi:adenylylsulfate reductase subunit B|nr:4Fe-4S binding protein [Clostridiales bacterium]